MKDNPRITIRLNGPKEAKKVHSDINYLMTHMNYNQKNIMYKLILEKGMEKLKKEIQGDDWGDDSKDFMLSNIFETLKTVLMLVMKAENITIDELNTLKDELAKFSTVPVVDDVLEERQFEKEG